MRSSIFRQMATIAVAAALAAAPVTATATPPTPKTLSAAEITSVLEKDVYIPGTAWMTQPDGTVVVSYDSTVVGTKLASLTKVTDKLGSNVKMEKLPGKLSRMLGGRGIYGGGYRCSLGFNTVRRGNYYFLMAGHCGAVNRVWYANPQQTSRLGNLHHFSYPGNDYALGVYRSNLRPPGTVSLYNGRQQDITRATTPGLGHTVYRSGITTGLRSGKVTGHRATVNYGDGRVGGLIRTSACAEPGDSGGPLFYRNLAFGLLSGGSGNCRTGGVTYYQPVVEALSRYGVAVF